ncbi:MAG: mechanosensitive ion channel [Gemmatimonadota bacterium]|nr:MAG: mechanosensitive ion channel [Gemmatimonadota bacterium]
MRMHAITALVLPALLGAGPSHSIAHGQILRLPGQAQRDTTADTLQAAPRPVPIPAPQVAQQAEETAQRLRAIRPLIAADPNVIDLAKQLPSLVSSIEELRADPASRTPALLSLRQLEALRQRWTSLRSQLEGWQSTLTSRSALLQSRRDSLSFIVATWHVTADTAEARGLPAATIEQINSVLASVEEVERELTQRLSAVLSLQNTVADKQIQASEVIARIETASQQARLNLLIPDAAPLWQAVVWAGLPQSQLRESLLADGRTLLQFIDGNSQRLAGALAISLLLLVLMIALRSKGKEWAEQDPELAAASLILDRPVSATLLVALIVLRFLFPDAHPAVVDVNRLLLLIPALRLLPRLLQPSMRRLLYGLAVLYLFQQLLEFLPEGSFLQRLSLLGLTALATAGLALVLRPGGLGESAAGQGGRLRLVLAFLRVALAGLAISLIANVLGFVALADLMTPAIILSALLAFVLFAGAQVVAAVVRLVLRTPLAQSLHSIRTQGTLVTRRAVRLTNLLAVVIWALGTLSAFDLLDPTISALDTALNTPLVVGALSISLGDVFAFGIAIGIAVIASRLVRFALQEDLLPRFALPRGVPGAISQLSHYIILGFGLLFALAAAGIDLSRLALLVGALGVGIGFGLQNIVNNFISGLILIFERPIQVGDTIELEPLLGTVRHIGIRASTVRTWEGAEVIVPNADLIAGKVVNWTLSDRQRRVDVQVGVAYGTDPDRVVAILVEVAGKSPSVLAHPEPTALFRGFGDSSLNFVLRAWTPEFERWMHVQSELTLAVHHALRDAGITIPFPQRDLHLRSVDPSIGGLISRKSAGDKENPRRPDPAESDDS